MQLTSIKEKMMEQIGQMPTIPDELPPEIEKKGLIYYGRNAIRLTQAEGEIATFSLLQWLVLSLLLIVWLWLAQLMPGAWWTTFVPGQKLFTVADIVVLFSPLLLIPIAAFPISLLTGCMGAAHFLRQQMGESTVITCIGLAIRRAWPLWIFHWIDGWITVTQCLSRIQHAAPRQGGAGDGDDPGSEMGSDAGAGDNADEGGTSTSNKAQIIMAQESGYLIWKIAVAGMLPAILSGNGLIASAKESAAFVRGNIITITGLRLAYSSACWLIGIACFVAGIASERLEWMPHLGYSELYTSLVAILAPVIIGFGILMVIVRPIYVLALCQLYTDHQASQHAQARGQ